MPVRQAWRFSTRDLPPAQRSAAWIDAMRRLRLPLVTLPDSKPMEGEVAVVESPLGLQFALIEADPQTITGQTEDEGEGLWLSVLLEGEGVLRAAGLEAHCRPGMILCGITRSPAELTLATRHRQLFVHLPRFVIAPRLLARPVAPLILIDASSGLGAVFRRLLEGVACEIDALISGQLSPVEHALIEFLVAMLAAQGGSQARGGASGARAMLVHRVLQRMEALLGDPDLSFTALAEDTGMSPRYLRRLFSAQGINFSSALKRRRLERCHEDLASPLHAQLSISEIAFRWGFNDAAHFSRSFREQYGVSPREFRQSLR